MAETLKNIYNRIKAPVKAAASRDESANGFHKAPEGKLFPKTDPLIDGEDCSHDCLSCSIEYPRGFSIDEKDKLYGEVNGWETHLIVATGKTDWVRSVEDEKGSIMEAVDQCGVSPSNGKMKLSASNMPVPDHENGTTVLLLPAFTLIDHVTPANTRQLVDQYINTSSANTTPYDSAVRAGANTAAAAAAVASQQSDSEVPSPLQTPQLAARPCPHRYLILMCSQKTRDARCGQSAPLLRREFERILRPLGLYRDLHDERPGGVGLYFISHVGGHKYSANVLIYRRGDATINPGDHQENGTSNSSERSGTSTDVLPGLGEAAQCIWLARVKPADCENIVRYTVLQGKVVKPETQLRGGFDREKKLVSW